jgi:hypothetical protein
MIEYRYVKKRPRAGVLNRRYIGLKRKLRSKREASEFHVFFGLGSLKIRNLYRPAKFAKY